MLKQERTFPKLLPQSTESSGMYAAALRFPFTGTKGPSPYHEKQPQNFIPPPPNFTVGTMHWGRWCSPGICQTQMRPSACQMVKCDSSLQRTNFHCSRAQWWRALHHSSRCLVLCMSLGLCFCSAMKTHFMKLPTNSSCCF